jgi:hypothetical protein
MPMIDIPIDAYQTHITRYQTLSMHRTSYIYTNVTSLSLPTLPNFFFLAKVILFFSCNKATYVVSKTRL